VFILMNAGGAVNAVGKQKSIYLKCVIDGSSKSANSGKMRGGSWG
jgi:hypothetical protein